MIQARREKKLVWTKINAAAIGRLGGGDHARQVSIQQTEDVMSSSATIRRTTAATMAAQTQAGLIGAHEPVQQN
jgi:hypothetical protein